jgi:hypothetical protein
MPMTIHLIIGFLNGFETSSILSLKTDKASDYSLDHLSTNWLISLLGYYVYDLSKDPYEHHSKHSSHQYKHVIEYILDRKSHWEDQTIDLNEPNGQSVPVPSSGLTSDFRLLLGIGRPRGAWVHGCPRPSNLFKSLRNTSIPTRHIYSSY